MRISSITFCFVTTLALPTLLWADPVTAGQLIRLQQTDNIGTPYIRAQGGGSFRVDLPGTTDDFLSFCLERNETGAFDQDIRVASISNEARDGGMGGVPPGGTGDPISGTTAFLYTQFRQGRAGYTDGFTTQYAIWYLEQEDLTPFSAAVTSLLNQAALDMAAAGLSSTYLGDVLVLNLFRASDNAANQDVLALIPTGPTPVEPVPEPGSLLLLGSGIVACARRIRSRNRR